MYLISHIKTFFDFCIPNSFDMNTEFFKEYFKFDSDIMCEIIMEQRETFTKLEATILKILNEKPYLI